eukprot:1149975-Pelagomonas_calceolata.AAC.2
MRHRRQRGQTRLLLFLGLRLTPLLPWCARPRRAKASPPFPLGRPPLAPKFEPAPGPPAWTDVKKDSARDCGESTGAAQGTGVAGWHGGVKAASQRTDLIKLGDYGLSKICWQLLLLNHLLQGCGKERQEGEGTHNLMFHSSNCLIDGEAGDGKGGVVKAVAVPKQALSINRPDTMAAMSALPRALSTVPKVRRAGVWLGADTVCPCWECKEKPHRASTDVLHICKLMFDCACETYVQSQPRSLSAALPEQVLRSKAVPALARPAVPIRQRQLSVRVQAGPAEVSAFSNEQKVRRGAKDSFDYRVFFKQGSGREEGQAKVLPLQHQLELWPAAPGVAGLSIVVRSAEQITLCTLSLKIMMTGGMLDEERENQSMRPSFSPTCKTLKPYLCSAQLPLFLADMGGPRPQGHPAGCSCKCL